MSEHADEPRELKDLNEQSEDPNPADVEDGGDEFFLADNVSPLRRLT